MSRPAFSLTDDQARALLQQMAPILEQHPIGNRNHRPFVRDFIHAVHAATGRTCSPVIYRRLPDTYAPGRTPSTNTLDQEKKAFLAELAQETRVDRELAAGSTGPDLAEVVQRAVQTALAQHAPAAASTRRSASNQVVLAQRDFLQARLAQSEQDLLTTWALASRLAADLQSAILSRDAMQAHVAAAEAETARHVQQAAQLVVEVGDQLRYAMRAIDEVRGETRTWKEHSTALERKLAELTKLLDVFRQAAYARDAAIAQLPRNDEDIP
ncbi:hypothetical protein [Actimicrobium antarcticum]|uniref:KfrA N-terminal DNA-binding domain-containing protein n=1 Tax=Actimicrobium antarcticum TaxID=1051899 RepID=A0ABP7SXW6_9BURK